MKIIINEHMFNSLVENNTLYKVYRQKIEDAKSKLDNLIKKWYING